MCNSSNRAYYTYLHPNDWGHKFLRKNQEIIDLSFFPASLEYIKLEANKIRKRKDKANKELGALQFTVGEAPLVPGFTAQYTTTNRHRVRMYDDSTTDGSDF